MSAEITDSGSERFQRPPLDRITNFIAVIWAVSCHIAFMHVTRKTNTELALVDSSIWISVVLLCADVPVVYTSIAHSKLSGLWVVAFFLLCAFLFWRREVVVFDAGRQQASWWRRRAFKTA